MGMPTFPQLSFVCPIPWNEMRGDDRERYCTKCSRTVVNLSLLTEAQRVAVLAEAQQRPDGLCVAYYQRLSGEFVSAETPVSPQESRRAVQFGVTALSAAALAVVAHHAPSIGQTLASAQVVAGASYANLRDETVEKATRTMSNIGRLFGGQPHEPDPPLMLLGMMVCPTPPAPTATPTSVTPSSLATNAQSAPL